MIDNLLRALAIYDTWISVEPFETQNYVFVAETSILTRYTFNDTRQIIRRCLIPVRVGVELLEEVFIEVF